MAASPLIAESERESGFDHIRQRRDGEEKHRGSVQRSPSEQLEIDRGNRGQGLLELFGEADPAAH
jgi:hypothetical protein